jgi:hypothetical protein
MPPSKKLKSQRKPGHGKMRFRRQGLRNAAPNAVRPGSPRAKTEPPKPSTNQKMLYLLESFAGAAVTSYVGALAVKYGLSPEIASALLGLGNGAAAISTDREALGHAARGGASAAGSQLLLLAVGPKPNPPAAPRVVAVQAPAPPAQPQRKNADLGALPPGMLDAAFENARAQLAVSGDGFPASFQPDHGHVQFHHAPVMP